MLPAVRVGRSLRCVAPVAAAVVAVAHPALADDTYRLAWSRAEGAEACLTETELADRVRGRLGREPFDDRAERTIEGQVGLGSEGFLAKLVIRAADSTVLGRRTIETRGADCAALGQAVTLAVVLTIDPDAPLDAAGEPPPAAAPALREAAPPPASPKAVPPPEPPRVAPRPRPSEAPTASARSPARASIGAGVVGALGLLPRAALGVELEGAFPAGSGVIVGARVLPSVETGDGHLGIALTSGKLGWCGGMPGLLPVSLCGALEAGVTSVVARDLVPVSPGDYPYLALAAGARLVLPPRGPVAFQLGASALLPLYRQRFRVEGGNARDFQASPLGGLLTLGLRLGG
jgi:hypothetical protein